MSLLAGKELELRPISVEKDLLVLVKHHLEASEGLGYLVARRGGEAVVVTHRSRSEELDDFIDDLKLELGLKTGRRPTHDEVFDVP